MSIKNDLDTFSDDMGIFTDYNGPDKPFLRRVKDWFIRMNYSIKYKVLGFFHKGE